MNARYILAGLAVIFLAMAISRVARGGAFGAARARTWFLIAFIFGVVSLVLFSRT